MAVILSSCAEIIGLAMVAEKYNQSYIKEIAYAGEKEN